MILSALSLLLAELTAGLLFPSESDRPFHLKTFPQRTLSADQIRAQYVISSEKTAEQVDLNLFFGKWADPQPWHDDGYKHIQQRLGALRTTLQSRQNVTVFRFSGVETDWFILVPDINGITLLHTQTVAT
jgi:Nuclease A inhibitor-like protein